jgi:hypothetical protein
LLIALLLSRAWNQSSQVSCLSVDVVIISVAYVT